MSNYWNNQEIKLREALLNKSIDEIETMLKKQYLNTSRKLIEELIEKYEVILSEGDSPLASHLYAYNRQYEMIAKIKSELNSLGLTEVNELEDRLYTMYVNNSQIIANQFNLTSSINYEQAKAAIQQIWVDDGLRFSDRIWQDKKALTEKLKDCMTDAISTGKSTDRLTEDLMQTFDVGYNSSKRIARTELAHIQIQSTVDRYKASGIKQYRYLTELDERTCELCPEYNDKIYDIDDTEHLPPIHPNCRCTILAVI